MNERSPVVTIAALYGAAGTVIGPKVAERLGVPFLDRDIPEAVAKRTGLPQAVVEGVDEAPRSGVQRLTARLGRASTIGDAMGGSVEQLDVDERMVRARAHELEALGFLHMVLQEPSNTGFGSTVGDLS